LTFNGLYSGIYHKTELFITIGARSSSHTIVNFLITAIFLSTSFNKKML
jgi:hypothetical protein